jgi:hypothetical protein
VILCTPAFARADDLKTAIKLEAGSEYDSNASRESSQDGSLTHDPAAVGRIGGRVELAWHPAARQSLRLDTLLAAKKYVGVDSSSLMPSNEDIAVISADARWDITSSTRPLAFGLRASYYDALYKPGVDPSMHSIDHDFRTGDVVTALALVAPVDSRLPASGLAVAAHSEQRAILTAGWRAFEFKPDHSYSFQGEHAGIAYRRSFQPRDPGPTYDVAVDYSAHHRFYEGSAFANICPAGQPLGGNCLLSTGVDRVDLLHIAGVELGYTGERIITLRYELAVDDSNSFGQSFVRHRVELSATTELPFWSLILTARGVLQLTQFLDPVLLTRDIGVLTIDEENRNALIVHLARDFGPRWTAEMKLAFYANEFATQELQYRRITGYLGLIYAFGR